MAKRPPVIEHPPAVPDGCIRARCEAGHGCITTPMALRRPCMRPGCGLRVVEISEATYERQRANERRELAHVMASEPVDLDVDAIRDALGLVVA